MRPRPTLDGLRPAQLPASDDGRRRAADRAAYTLAEVAAHDQVHDGWIAVRGVVYDITPFAAHHPGWTLGGQTSTALAIARTLGTDCTAEFV